MVARWKASGESAVEFARGLGVHVRTLCRWRRLVEELDDGVGGPALARIVEVRSRPTQPAAESFEVRLAGGIRVSVPPSFEGPALERLLRVLEGVS